MSKKPIIGVMGPGSADNSLLLEHAEKIGESVARNGWILLTGGRPAGVMEAASRGADRAGGLTIGILPDENPASASRHVHIPVVTGMGQARNVINILSSDVVVICGMGAGTLSEAAFAIKHHKPVVTTFLSANELNFLNRLSGKTIPNHNDITTLVKAIKKLLKSNE